MKPIALVFNQSCGGRLIRQCFDGFTEWETHSSSQLHINHKLTRRFKRERERREEGLGFVLGVSSKRHYVNPLIHGNEPVNQCTIKLELSMGVDQPTIFGVSQREVEVVLFGERLVKFSAVSKQINDCMFCTAVHFK